MKYRIQILPELLHFRQPAGTSRGVYTTRRVWYVRIEEPATGRWGIGECAPLPDLSCDAVPDYPEHLEAACRQLERTGKLEDCAVKDFPSIRFGLETALRHLEKGSIRLADTAFSRGETGIPINGLIWMGRAEEMLERIREKLEKGFRCIKLKIGAIDFAQELSLLEHIRSRFGPEQIELRVDANGAFSPADAMEKLQALSRFRLHSIEQPIRAGQWKEMAALCRRTPIPIALDEELIGLNRREEKIRMLDTVQPAYIILKPSLHGGISGSEEWIALAQERGIGWWVTSALESNVGLNALAQWCSTLGTALPQGLGTGMLFTDNIDYPLQISGDCLRFDPMQPEPDFGPLLKKAQKQKDFEDRLAQFLSDWNSPEETLMVQTSGSTGTPKKMKVRKDRMRASAQMTCRYLGLQPGDRTLLCMPLDYIAGKMVVVRAAERGLRLQAVAPDSHPLAELEEAPDFAAMVPLQVHESLKVPAERALLKQIRHLIIGGGAIDPGMAETLKTFPNAVWSTYGMTETLSHIALRRLSGPQASDRYTPLPGIRLSTGPEGALIIHAPHLCEETLYTHDVAELYPDGTFRIKGRTDNIICSGGIKIQLEEVERLLSAHTDRAFQLTAGPDPAFGEALVLLCEGPAENIRPVCEACLPPYWRPKHYLEVTRLPVTGTGKPDRAAARKMAEDLFL